MDTEEILNIFRKSKTLLDGHFLLSSGLHSAQYLQCALVLQYPKMAERLCVPLADKFRGDNPNVVIAPAMGGILVSYEVARALGIKGIFTERVNKDMCLRRGFSLSREDRVLIVEDVITTGRSTKEVVDVVNSYGSLIVGVGCIIDRSQERIDFGVQLKSLLKIDIATFNPKECPLCENGVPVVKPGSRVGVGGSRK